MYCEVVCIMIGSYHNTTTNFRCSIDKKKITVGRKESLIHKTKDVREGVMK